MIELVTNKEQANCITHAGKMHADDVFATAFLELFLKNIKVARVTEVTENDYKENKYIYDIGLKKFDHHQQNPKQRENKITYCSFGLLWQEYGLAYLKNEGYENIHQLHHNIDLDLVEAIDADDNGMFPKIEANYKVKTLSTIIDMFNPSYASEEDYQTQFLKAVNIAKDILIEEIRNINGKLIANDKATKIISECKSNVLELEEYIPYSEALYASENVDICFVIFPSDRGGYVVNTVQKSIDNHALRVPFPIKWAGLTNKDLEKVSGVKGATFCHNKLFIATAKTKKAAHQLVEKALDCKVQKEKQDSLLTKDI